MGATLGTRPPIWLRGELVGHRRFRQPLIPAEGRLSLTTFLFPTSEPKDDGGCLFRKSQPHRKRGSGLFRRRIEPASPRIEPAAFLLPHSKRYCAPSGCGTID